MSAEQDNEAKQFKIKKDMAGLYVYRNQEMRSDLKMEIFLNGKLVAKNAYKTYVYLELKPGKYLLKETSNSNSSYLDLDLKPGTNTFVQQTFISEALFSYSSRLTKVHPLEGKDSIKKCDRIKTINHDFKPLK